MSMWILPIKPKWAELIYSGEKTVEVRTWVPDPIVVPHALGDGKDWVTVLLYETIPVQQITGSVQLRFRDRYECCNVTDELLADGCLSREEFDQYTQWLNDDTRDSVDILDLYDGRRFETPQTIADHGLKRAPQSWVRSRRPA